MLLEQSRAEAAAAVARAASAEAEAAAAKRHLFESPAVQLQAELQLKRFQVRLSVSCFFLEALSFQRRGSGGTSSAAAAASLRARGEKGVEKSLLVRKVVVSKALLLLGVGPHGSPSSHGGLARVSHKKLSGTHSSDFFAQAGRTGSLRRRGFAAEKRRETTRLQRTRRCMRACVRLVRLSWQQVTSAHLWGSDLHSQLRLVWAEVETLQRALTSLGLQQQPSQTQASTLPPTEMPTDPGRRPLHSQLGKRDAPAAVASADAADEESLSNNNPSSTGKGGGGDSRAMALQQEIDALLLTGVYSEEDALVQSLRRAKLEAENEAAASDELGG